MERLRNRPAGRCHPRRPCCAPCCWSWSRQLRGRLSKLLLRKRVIAATPALRTRAVERRRPLGGRRRRRAASPVTHATPTTMLASASPSPRPRPRCTPPSRRGWSPTAQGPHRPHRRGVRPPGRLGSTCPPTGRASRPTARHEARLMSPADARTTDGLDPRRWWTLRRPVPQPPHRLRRQLQPERRPPDALGEPRRHQRPVAVGRRDLLTGLRRPAVHGRRAGRPVRAQGRPAARPGDLPPRRDARRGVHHDQPADRLPGPDGCRRRADHAVDAVDPRQRLPAPRAHQGHRDLGRDERRRRRVRTGGQRVPARPLLVRRGVPRQRARSSPWR